MFDFNKILKDAQVYSIEYCGFYVLKFSISNELNFSRYFQDITVEFTSGIDMLSNNKVKADLDEEVLKLYGMDVLDAQCTVDKRLKIKFSNGYIIQSLQDENELVDRDWVIEVTNDKDNYILCDRGHLYFSNNIKSLFY